MRVFAGVWVWRGKAAVNLQRPAAIEGRCVIVIE